MHENQRIHRDLKSDNILMNTQGKIKISDLGFSIQLTQERSARNTIAGTPCWIAPEIIKCAGYGIEADIWSFGVLIIEILEGEPPHIRLSQEEIFQEIITNNVSLANPENVNPDYIRLINSCIQQSPANRKSARELLEDPIFQHKALLAEFSEFISSVPINKSGLHQ